MDAKAMRIVNAVFFMFKNFRSANVMFSDLGLLFNAKVKELSCRKDEG
jgi:hypothetical protein